MESAALQKSKFLNEAQVLKEQRSVKSELLQIINNNPNLSERFTALVVLPSLLWYSFQKISSLRQHHAVRKHVLMELNADNRSISFRGNVHWSG
jgi:hypothetical protein